MFLLQLSKNNNSDSKDVKLDEKLDEKSDEKSCDGLSSKPLEISDEVLHEKLIGELLIKTVNQIPPNKIMANETSSAHGFEEKSSSNLKNEEETEMISDSDTDTFDASTGMYF